MSLEEAFTHFPALTTERLRLRDLRAGDADAFYAIKSDLEVTRPYGREPHRSVEETRKWMDECFAGYGRGDSILWAVDLQGGASAVGSCCFWHYDRSDQTAEIGYELQRSHWGKGIATEAVSAMVRYGFEKLGLHRIEACPLGVNDPSRRLLLRLGFTQEGTLRQRVLFRGHFEDLLYFGLLRGEARDIARVHPRQNDVHVESPS